MTVPPKRANGAEVWIQCRRRNVWIWREREHVARKRQRRQSHVRVIDLKLLMHTTRANIPHNHGQVRSEFPLHVEVPGCYVIPLRILLDKGRGQGIGGKQRICAFIKRPRESRIQTSDGVERGGPYL